METRRLVALITVIFANLVQIAIGIGLLHMFFKSETFDIRMYSVPAVIILAAVLGSIGAGVLYRTGDDEPYDDGDL